MKTILIAALVVAANTAAAEDWTGAHAGLRLDYTDIEVEPYGGDGASNAGDGAFFGVVGGYRYDLGAYVIGGTLSYVQGDVAVPSLGDAMTPADPKVDAILRAGIEVGYDAEPYLLYATVGSARIDATSIFGDSMDETGAFFGVGADYLMSDKVILGAELIRTNVDDFAGADYSATTLAVLARYSF